MSAFEFTNENLPSSEEFRQLFSRADENEDPLEELLRLERGLAMLEAEHGLTSAEFLTRYQMGEMGDDLAYISWAGRYRLYLNLKRAISDSLRWVVAVSDLSLS